MKTAALIYVLLAFSAHSNAAGVADFSSRYAIRQNDELLFEISDSQSVVGWIYGTTHYAPKHDPAISQTALNTLLKAKRIYFETVDLDGIPVESLEMRSIKPLSGSDESPSPEEAIAAVALLQRARRNGASHVDLVSSTAHREAVLKALAFCGHDQRYGTESMILDFLSGSNYRIYPLETEATRNKDNLLAREEVAASSADTDLADEIGIPSSIDDENINLFKTKLCDELGAGIRIRTDTASALPPTSRISSALLKHRNDTMLSGILSAFGRQELPFIAIGAAHVLGDSNLLSLLQSRGYAFKRVRNLMDCGSHGRRRPTKSLGPRIRPVAHHSRFY